MYKFAAASKDERIVFGCARPGYTNDQVNDWIRFMQNQGIQRICCLLPKTQLARYSDLLSAYRQRFGSEQLCWATIEDFELVDADVLVRKILPFLAMANQQQEKVVVHCSGGIGRTGQILAAWLVTGRGFSPKSAIAAVKEMGRNPHESVIAAPFKGRNPWKVTVELNAILEECDRHRDKLI
jgi:protein-tyrosine phosphatase